MPLIALACSDSSVMPPANEDSGADAAAPDDVIDDPPTVDDAGIDSAVRTTRVCTDEGWCHTRLPPGEDLRDLWGDSQGDVWVVSAQGNILRWDGRSWQVSSSGNGPLEAIWGASPTDLWAGGERGILRGRGTGDASTVTWTLVDLGEEYLEVRDIAGSGPDDVWAGGRDPYYFDEETFRLGRPRAFHLDGRDGIWNPDPLEAVTSHPQYDQITDIRRLWAASNGDLWMHASDIKPGDPVDLQFYRSLRAPSRWVEAPLPGESIDAPGSMARLTGVGALGDDVWLFGRVYANDGSLTVGYWTGRSEAISAPSDWKLGMQPRNWEKDGPSRTGVWGLAPDNVWTIGTAGRIDHWDGTTWRMARTVVADEPIKTDLRAIWGRNNDDLWVVGGPYALHKVSQAEAARLNAEAAAHIDEGK